MILLKVDYSAPAKDMFIVMMNPNDVFQQILLPGLVHDICGEVVTHA